MSHQEPFYLVFLDGVDDCDDLKQLMRWRSGDIIIWTNRKAHPDKTDDDTSDDWNGEVPSLSQHVKPVYIERLSPQCKNVTSLPVGVEELYYSSNNCGLGSKCRSQQIAWWWDKVTYHQRSGVEVPGNGSQHARFIWSVVIFHTVYQHHSYKLWALQSHGKINKTIIKGIKSSIPLRHWGSLRMLLARGSRTAVWTARIPVGDATRIW